MGGYESNEFQLMIHGEKVGECEVAIENEDIKLKFNDYQIPIIWYWILKFYNQKAFDFVLTFSKMGWFMKIIRINY